MSDQSPTDRYKPDMPQIPGVSSTAGRSNLLNNPTFRLIGGLLVVLLAVFFTARWLLRPHHTELATAEPPPKIDVPAPAPDPNALLPHASETEPVIADSSEMAQPWSSKKFFFKKASTGENVPAMLIRLPSASAAQERAYWAFSLDAPYGNCRLEFITDISVLKNDYDFKAARHPMVGNPCSRTLYDPTRLTNLPGDVWVRGAIVQGSDLRPPLGIEIKVRGKTIEAVRME